MAEKKQQVKNSTFRKILYMVFSLLCALLLWVYVTEQEGEDIERTFPGVRVVFDGESVMRDSRGLIISDTTANSVKVSLTGNRRTVSSLHDSDLTVVIDLSGITKTGNYSLAPKVTYSGKLDTSAITQELVNPATVSFYVDKLDKKTIPVVGVFNGSPAEGFSADPIEFSPSTVVISGPAKELAAVDHALVEINRENVDKTLNFDSTYQLIDGEGAVVDSDEIALETDTVGVTLPINAVKEVALVVDFVAGAGATSDNVKWKLEPDTITLTGDSETLDGVNNISLAKIDLATVDEALTETYKIVIPNDTEITSGAKEATLTLELDGLYKQTVDIDKSNITCTNVSEGYHAEIMSESVENVVLRGPESVVKGLSSVNIRAVADLTAYGTATGIVAVPAKIVIDGTTEVGALGGNYTVYVYISRAEAPEE